MTKTKLRSVYDALVTLVASKTAATKYTLTIYDDGSGRGQLENLQEFGFDNFKDMIDRLESLGIEFEPDQPTKTLPPELPLPVGVQRIRAISDAVDRLNMHAANIDPGYADPVAGLACDRRVLAEEYLRLWNLG